MDEGKLNMDGYYAVPHEDYNWMRARLAKLEAVAEAARVLDKELVRLIGIPLSPHHLALKTALAALEETP